MIGPPLEHEEAEQIKQFNVQIESYTNLSNEEILEKYQQADIISFPSTFEGFGMPIIEGQMIGKVILTSKIEPMTSVAGEAAHFVDPLDINSIKEGFLKITHDENYRNDLIKKGFSNKERFSPDSIAQQYYDLYKKFTII